MATSVDDLVDDLFAPEPAATKTAPAPAGVSKVDDLVDDLFAPEPASTRTAAAPAGPSKASSAGRDVADLVDDLFGEADSSRPAAGPVVSAAACPAKAREDSGATAKAAASPPPPPAPPPAPQSAAPSSASSAACEQVGSQTAQVAADAVSVDSSASTVATAAAAKETQEPSGHQSFRLSGEASPTKAERTDSLEEWYTASKEPAEDMVSKRLEKTSEAEAEKAETASSAGQSKSIWSSAAAWKKKASKLGAKATKALVQEAKRTVEDVKEISQGVKEGVHLTAQDLGFLHTATPPATPAAAKAPPPPAAAPKSSASSAVQKQGSEKAATSSTTHESSSEAEGRTMSAIRQGLAATAEVSFELWRDAKQDVQSDLQLLVSGFRTIREGGGAQADEPEGKEATAGAEAAAAAEDRSNTVGKAAMGLWRGLRGLGSHSQGAGGSSQEPCSDAFWSTPSTRANYVSLQPSDPPAAAEGATAEAASPAPKTTSAATSSSAAARTAESPPPAPAGEAGSKADKGVHLRVRDLGGRLAKQTAGLMQQARVLGQNPKSGKPAPAEEEAGNEACDGDSIFEIGSEEEEGLSDPGEVGSGEEKGS